MALKDLIKNVTFVAGLALVPAYACGGGSGRYDCNTTCENIKHCCETNYYDPGGRNFSDCKLFSLNECISECSNDPERITDDEAECLATTCKYKDCF